MWSTEKNVTLSYDDLFDLGKPAASGKAAGDVFGTSSLRTGGYELIQLGISWANSICGSDSGLSGRLLVSLRPHAASPFEADPGKPIRMPPKARVT